MSFWPILTFQASAFDHSATAPHIAGRARPRRMIAVSQGMVGSAREAFRNAGDVGMMRGMKPHLLIAAALLGASPLAAETTPAPAKTAAALAPSEIVAASPKTDWVGIAASDLLVMDLAPGGKGKSRRVVIQLLPPPFSSGWVGNIRKLAAAHWWDGLSINRVQDNYVVQWGDADGEDKAKARKLPDGLAVVPESDYFTEFGPVVLGTNKKPQGLYTAGSKQKRPEIIASFDMSLRQTFPTIDGFRSGWPVAIVMHEVVTMKSNTALWPIHCYGMVGVGRDLSPNTGTGAELYAVIGHAPRHLDRNIALVGRVIEGIENLSSLPRGTGALGFYEHPEERTGIASVRLGNEVPGLPAYEFLSTESASFARYADARANRRDAFFIRPAGGADICNIPVPVRRVK